VKFDLAICGVKSGRGYAMTRLDNYPDDDGIITLELAPRPTRRRASGGVIYFRGR